MKSIVRITLIISIVFFASCENKRAGTPKVLVFSKTMGFKHASIPAGIAAIQELGKENGFAVDTTINAELFNEENLKQYSAIIFLSTTMNVLNHYQEAAFERYIQAGGGYMGIHAAADTEYDWGWYNKLVGAQFLSHPSGTPNANFVISDNNFIATKHFTDSIWNRSDELYNYKNINPDVNVLMTVDESTYEGGENGDFHPIAWYHEFDGGRAFYTGAGHTDESFKDEMFLKHILGGIQYAIGDNLELNHDKVRSQIPPENDRFSKVELVGGGFFEPTEMTVLPNNDVLIAQRRGEILLYSDGTKELNEIAKLDVYHKTLKAQGVNVEEGLMGLQKDPDFESNNWIYTYYAPTGNLEVNRLSRFKFENGKFDMGSEQIILEVESQREICCHTGGSIAFGPGNLLYLSTGDNSTPFNEEGEKYVNSGYAPLNDTPGHEQFDARRSSGNTNDLRGKILRIKVNEDGSYDIPEGNLFPVGTEKTRSEIYTMGHRNPYRISVDVKKGYVYWGDVGPDARVDSLQTRGPRGYDEMNQAREAGNFGWPLFIGDNKPYVAYNYKTGESGSAFNPDKPINNSRNNTGLTELPKAMPAYAFYPYSETQDFPQVGSGGRNAMAGPTYYSDLYYGTDKLPSYYDGKVIIYEWMRGWMMAIHLNGDGSFSKMEPFASDIKVNSLIDMEIGPNGKIYLLEYGSGWFSQNEDSGLSYIKFNGGNRPPLIDNLIVDRTSGTLPLTINASVEARDREKDEMTYVWDLGNGETKETTEPELTWSYEEPGAYKVMVTIIDSGGESTQSNAMSIVAGNSRPKISIDLDGGNTSFYVPGQDVAYDITVSDPDDNQDINEENIFVSVDYLEGMDKASMSLGHQQVSEIEIGKALTQAMDCKTCHKPGEASIGPTYTDIANKYNGQKGNMAYLQEKIVVGGEGVWGEVMMPAHPKITTDESRQIALYITSLGDHALKKESLPIKGKIKAESNPGQMMVITASYTDSGLDTAPPLTGTKSVALSSNTVTFPKGTVTDGMMAVQFGGMDLQLLNETNGGLLIENIDLTGVKAVVLAIGWQDAPKLAYNFEIHLNDANGPLIGRGSMPQPQVGQPGGAGVIPLSTQINRKTNIYISYAAEEGKEPSMVALVNATFN
ncbi:ThuA domain-containing protein [Croceitalea rosinachiae]|uniref:ThuA domain-containing protein n=1 Tax=Croceitalea rosinachiae TaxID=3075596 RepID=A0ABU3AAE3_9FLAO|nr:ThuA domain-containing protein [Croceitalea sp. F388]MDT0607144.1 ThuA domain-containing protein [Croceitalea sp. F388]